MTNWEEEHCSRQPEELQIIGPGLLMERRNIREVTHEATDDMPAYTEWICECREIKTDEYNMIKTITEHSDQEAIDNYTAELMEAGLL